ncbi:WAT1-related protein At1g09380-like [Vicia villosa]|uniref:WAT1-related protein At1g09380-like n=1 Tax=Vicia villosa TaxID=3911 RepID=UPI00273C0967|nr:WAT1-related protein At1g09380-like [Vicia villosa]
MGFASFIPCIFMLINQLAYSGMNVTSKLAIVGGMNPLVLVAYRQIFGTVAIAPFAYWLERDIVPRMTKRIMIQIFLSSVTGVTGNQVLYFVGLKYSTATIACALTNLLPAFTFVLAVLFRQENLGIRTKRGIAKVVGTMLCVGGAILLSFYHGQVIGIGQSSIHWSYAEKLQSGGDSSGSSGSSLLGPVLLILSALIWSLWFIIQADMSKNFPVPYTSTTYMCFLASIQCVFIALCFDHSASSWSLRNAMRIVSSVYTGVICTALTYCLISWTIERKGPLYVSVFTPLQLILTAIISWAFLSEQLYLGTALGSLLIVFGLYGVLWGKSQEADTNKLDEASDQDEGVKRDDMEMQSYVMPLSNGNGHGHGNGNGHM